MALAVLGALEPAVHDRAMRREAKSELKSELKPDAKEGASKPAQRVNERAAVISPDAKAPDRRASLSMYGRR